MMWSLGSRHISMTCQQRCILTHHLLQELEDALAEFPVQARVLAQEQAAQVKFLSSALSAVQPDLSVI